MGKTLETKNRIIELLRNKEMTPTEISEALHLVPSTVSQHLRELRDIGVLHEVPNPHFHNTKTFRLAQDYNPAMLERGQRISAASKFNPRIALGAILVLAVIGVLAYELSTTTSILGAGTSSLPVLLTDPPQVPNGTTALTLYYNGVALHTAGHSNSTGFLRINESGSVDLLSLVNTTDVLALAKVNSTAQFDAVAIFVSKATMTLDNETYNVTVPGDVILIRLNQTLNASSGGALVDFNPTVVQVYGANGSSFVLVPSGVALALSKGAIGSGLRIGAINQLTPPLRAGVAYARARSNDSITGASVSINGDNETISVTVKDTGNSSMVLRNVLVYGFMRAVGNYSYTGNYRGNYTFPRNGTSHTPFPYNGAYNGVFNGTGQFPSRNGIRQQLPRNGVQQFPPNGQPGMPFGQLPPPIRDNVQAAIQQYTKLNASSGEYNSYVNQTLLFEANYYHMLSFSVGSNGTLSLPKSFSDIEAAGYTLSPGQSVTLVYNGTINVRDSRLAAVMIPNASYQIVVTGEGNGFAATTVTAT